jgi:hypothetical protein
VNLSGPKPSEMITIGRIFLLYNFNLVKLFSDRLYIYICIYMYKYTYTHVHICLYRYTYLFTPWSIVLLEKLTSLRS